MVYPSQDWWVPPSQEWMGYLPTGLDGVHPPTQDRLYLDRLCRGWYAFCGYPQEDCLVNNDYLLGKVITTRIQRMGEGNIFSLFTVVGGGVPLPGLDGGGGTLSQVWGGTPSQVRGVPQPGLDGGGYLGYPPVRSGWWGYSPGQVWIVGGYPWYPSTTRTGWGTPHQDWMGYPPPSTTRTGWGTPPTQVWMVGGTRGTPTPMRQSSIASTCYAAGGVPLAFTQEDFLVFNNPSPSEH